MNIDNKNIETVLSRFLAGDKSIACDRLHVRSDQRGGLYRLAREDGTTVVAKVWQIHNVRERFKSTVRISNGWREWCMQRIAYTSGIATPQPFAFFRFSTMSGDRVEALLMEDIGEVVSSMQVLKLLISNNNALEVASFEDRLISITTRFIDLKFIDIDHQLNNLVVDKKGRILRLDFECTKRRIFGFMKQNLLITMIARFITGHIHAVQPNVSRSVSFAERLFSALNLNCHQKAMIQGAVDANLHHQMFNNNVCTKVSLPL